MRKRKKYDDNNNQLINQLLLSREMNILHTFILLIVLYISHIFPLGIRPVSAEPIENLDVDKKVKIPRTGSWQNCTQSFKPLSEARQALLSTDNVHADSDIVIISCNHIHYRVPRKSIDRIKSNTAWKEPIVIGVLSGAGGDGLSKRNSIRSTWAYRKQNVFFIVAGPWSNIEYEYNRFGDLLWIDKEEIYITETSVLTFKTETFVAVMYNTFMKDDDNHVSFLFKADDDSYVDLEKLYRALLYEPEHRNYRLDYWGKCNEGGWKPHRDETNKWFISYEIYPEPEYPPFCQGAGIAMSKHFLDCAVGLDHVSNVRYQPNEDVAIGLLAERCNVKPVHDDRVLIRYDEVEEEGITMHKKIVQHYVKTEEAMRKHHQCVTGVLGPVINY